MLSISPFFSKVGGNSGLPVKDILVCIVKDVAQISEIMLLNVRAAIFKLPGLLGRERHIGIGQ